MMEIERFTRQDIPVQMLEGFGPDEGEKAEPIAMGRQTLWGGAGKPPSREVMQAAAKAARSEMMERIRANKPARTAGRGNRKPEDHPRAPRTDEGAGRARGPRHDHAPARHRDDSQPYGENAHLGTQLGRMGMEPRRSARGNGGQPDPMRTSADLMGQGARRGGPRGNNRARGPRGGGRAG